MRIIRLKQFSPLYVHASTMLVNLKKKKKKNFGGGKMLKLVPMWKLLMIYLDLDVFCTNFSFVQFLYWESITLVYVGGP